MIFVRVSVCRCWWLVLVVMTTTAVAAVTRRSAGEVACHLPAAGTWKKLSHLLLAAQWTDARHRRYTLPLPVRIELEFLLQLNYHCCNKHDGMMYDCAFSDKLLIQEDPALYFFINQGCLTVDNMDDKEEMHIVDVRSFPLCLLLYLFCVLH